MRYYYILRKKEENTVLNVTKDYSERHKEVNFTVHFFFLRADKKISILLLTTELRGKGTPIREAINGATSAYKQKKFNSNKSTDINKKLNNLMQLYFGL